MLRYGGVSSWLWRAQEEVEGGLMGEVISQDMARLQIFEDMTLDRKMRRSSIRVVG